jgi:hypothetical protein
MGRGTEKELDDIPWTSRWGLQGHAVYVMVVGPSGTHVYLLRQNKDVQSAYIQCQAALHILITATPTLWSYDNLSGQLKVMQKPEHDRLAQELSFEECRELYTFDTLHMLIAKLFQTDATTRLKMDWRSDLSTSITLSVATIVRSVQC